MEAPANINTLSCYALTLVNESNWFVSSRYKLHNLSETENVIEHCLNPKEADSTPFYHLQNTLSTVVRVVTTLAISILIAPIGVVRVYFRRRIS